MKEPRNYVDPSIAVGGPTLLPRSLGRAWESDPLPDWLRADLKLSPQATYGDLAHLVGPSDQMASERVRRFLARKVQASLHDLGDLRAVGEDWPLGMSLDEVGLLTRTRNAIWNAGFRGSPERLTQLTFRELAGVRGLGGVGVLDLTCGIENAIDQRVEERALAEGQVDSAIAQLDGAGLSTSSAEPVDSRVSEELFSAISEPWAAMVSELDPRFTAILPPGTGTILDRVEELTLSLSGDSHNAAEAELAGAIAKVRDALSEMERQPLQQGAGTLISALTGWEVNRVDAVLKRLGFTRSGPATLEEVGQQLGVSRERARQYMSALMRKLPPHPLAMPPLDRALSILSEAAPILAEQAGELLVTHAICQEPVHPVAVLELAQLCGRPTSLRIESISGTAFVLYSEEPVQVEALLRVARKQAAASGATTVFDVVQELAGQGIEVLAETAHACLRAASEIEFLDNDWIWFPGAGSSRARTLARKMLAVNQPQSVPSLRVGMRRENRFRKTRGRSGWPLVVPPTEVLTEMFRRHPEFNIDELGNVASAVELDFRVDLPPAERGIVEAFRASASGILDRADLLRSAAERGLSPSTVSVMLSYSSVFDNLGGGLWTTRGMHHDLATVDAVRSANALRPRVQRTIGHTWTPRGELSIAFRLPQLLINPTLSIPSTILRYVAGRDFLATAEGSEDVGSIRVYESGFSAGYMPFLRQSRAEEGDVLVADFDLVHDTVTLHLEVGEVLDLDAYD